MSASRRSPPIRPRCGRCRNSACTARCSSSSRAASAPAPTWPRRWRSAPTRSRSAPRRWSRSATTIRHHRSRNTRRSARTAGAYDDWHEGRDPAGITTQDPALASGLDPVLGGRRLANYLAVMTLEAQTIARACGKSTAQSRAGRSRRAHHRGGGDGEGAAGGHRLDSRRNSAAGFRRIIRRELEPGTTREGRGSWHRSVLRKGKGHQVFPRFVRRPVRRDARETRAGGGDRRRWQRRAPALPALRLARHDPARPRHPGDPRAGKPHPAAVEARGRLGDAAT